MKYTKILTLLLAIGMSSTSFAGPGRGTVDRTSERVRTESQRAAEVARRDFETLGFSVGRLFDEVVNIDVKLTTGRAESKISTSLEALTKLLSDGQNAGHRATMQNQIQAALVEVSSSLTRAKTAMETAEGSREALTPEAMELIQINEAVVKLIGEAVKTGEVASFDNIDAIQKVLKELDFSDAEKVAAAKAEILKITGAEKLDEVIKCTV